MDDNASAPDGRGAYFAEARSWAQDRLDEARRSRRIAWYVAGGAVAVAVLEALALVALAPLKTVVPYTLLVDRNTGFAQVLEGNDHPVIKPQAALTQSLLAQYVIARETFDINGLPEQYRKVAIWSADRARQDYLSLMPAGNPDSPINRYPRSSVVTTHIESVTPTGPDTALVRFYTEQQDQSLAGGPRSYWVSLVRFRFSGEPLALDDRLVNPLGFQVVHYRRDQESPPVADKQLAAASPLVPGQPRATPAAGPAPIRSR